MPTLQASLDFSHPSLPTEQHRFDQPVAVLFARQLNEVLPLIKAADDAARAGQWVLGFVAYEAAPAFDAALPVHAADPTLPLAVFAFYDAPSIAPPSPPSPEFGAFTTTPWHSTETREAFDHQIDFIRSGIAQGDYYQVNLTARHNLQFSGQCAALYASLRAAQPQSFGLFFDAGDFSIASVSPELFFDWQGGELQVRPMKGTAPRHADPIADAAARQTLGSSDKERAENLMIVDLLRNDLSRVACLGSVRVERLFEVEALATAWQMTSTIRCATPPEATLVEVFGALFPCGSVTGAPKRAAMQAIRDREATARGVYCGALGVVRPGGHATFSVGIRTVVVAGDQASCGIGSGITLDSSAAGEWAEWAVKRRFLWRATAPFELLETLLLHNGDFARSGRHVERMLGSAIFFGFPLERQDIEVNLKDLARKHPQGRWRVRLLADRAGDVRSEIFEFQTKTEPANFVLATTAIDGDPTLCTDLLAHKTTTRAHYPAAPAGVFEVLLWNRQGHITEFTRGNLVYEWQGRRYTPPADGTLLPGVLRAELLACGEISERPLAVSELADCGALWFINSLRGQIPVQQAK